MLKIEYKILKYIYKHGRVPKNKLSSKFKKHNIELILLDIAEYVNTDIKTMIYDDDGNPTLEYSPTPESLYRLNKSGNEYVERRKHEFRMFFFPYLITTAIAITSLLTQLLPLIIELCSKLQES